MRLRPTLGLAFFEKRAQPLLAFGRHAARGDAAAVIARRIVDGAPATTSRDQRLGRGDRLRARRQHLVRRSASTAASSSAAGTTSWTRPISRARAAEKRAPVRNSSRAADRPIFASANGEITAGRMPSFASVNPNSASLVGDDDVADRGQAGAAAERGAVNAADDAASAARRSPRTSATSPWRRARSRLRCRRRSSPSTRRRRRRRTSCPAPAMTTTRTSRVLRRRASPRPRRSARRSTCFVEGVADVRAGSASMRSTAPSRSTMLVRALAQPLDLVSESTSGRRRTSARGIGALNAADSPSASACASPPDRECRRPTAARWSSRAILRARTCRESAARIASSSSAVSGLPSRAS